MSARNLRRARGPSWTPLLAGSTTPGTQTYATQAAMFVIDNAVCEVWGNIGLSAKDAATAGNVSILGLPVPCNSGITGVVTFGYTRNWDLDTAGGFYRIDGLIGPSTSQIDLYQSGDNVVPVQLTAAAFGATTYIYFWARYPI